MKRILWIVAGAILLVGVCFLIDRGVGVRKRTTAEAFDLPSAELTELEAKVRDKNDTGAAIRLYQYYGWSRGISSNALYYLRIAATNGNADAQYNLAVNLILTRDKLNREEAKSWLEKSAAGGNGDAKKGVEDWDNFVSQWQ